MMMLQGTTNSRILGLLSMALMLRQKIINIILTFIQYIGFGVFLYLSPWMADGFTLQFIEFSGIALAIWGFRGQIFILAKRQKWQT